MTLSSTTSKVSYNGDGATASFSINFVFWDSEDLEVTLRAADGTETTWVEGTQYTVSGGNGSTGTLTVKTTPTDYTPASGEKLVIRDKQSELQEDSLPLSGSFPSTVVEQRLDKITRLIQIHSEEIARSILLPVSTSLSGLVLPEPGAGELLRYNGAGTDLETVAAGDLATAIDTLFSGLANNDLLIYESAGAVWKNLTPGATGLALLQDATAAAARTELGLGTAATKNVGVSNGQVPQMDATGYPAADGSQITDVAAASAPYSGLTGVPDLVQILDKDPTENEIVNTAAETTLYTYTVPANTLGTDKAIRVSLRGDYLNNSGVGSKTFTVKVKYGATTLWEDAVGGFADSATRRAWDMEVILTAVDLASVQLLSGRFLVSGGTAPTTGDAGDISGGLPATGGILQGSAAEDSTGALAFAVTITHSTMDANISIRRKVAVTELLP